MSAISKIQWTDRTWNPVRGCSVISPGCVNCYAMKQAHRFGGAISDKRTASPHKHGNDRAPKVFSAPYAGLTHMTKAGPQWTGVVRFIDADLFTPLTWRKPQRVFVNSMSDLFHEGLSFESIDEIFAVMTLASKHTFQILTKRADRMRAYLTTGNRHELVTIARRRTMRHVEHYWSKAQLLTAYAKPGDEWDQMESAWPLPNVWLGVSVEDQQRADERIPLLLQTPAAVRFLSAEPLLSGIDIAKHRPGALGLHWVISGGESGPNARESAVWWHRNLLGQCRDAGVAFFLKQLGKIPTHRCDHCGKTVGRVTGGFVDSCGEKHKAMIDELIKVRDTKGGDPAEWPADLRVREFPQVSR